MGASTRPFPSCRVRTLSTRARVPRLWTRKATNTRRTSRSSWSPRTSALRRRPPSTTMCRSLMRRRAAMTVPWERRVLQGEPSWTISSSRRSTTALTSFRSPLHTRNLRARRCAGLFLARLSRVCRLLLAPVMIEPVIPIIRWACGEASLASLPLIRTVTSRTIRTTGRGLLFPLWGSLLVGRR